MSIISIKGDEDFLKEFLKDFYQKIIDLDDVDDYLVSFENTLNEWINKIVKDTQTILELMQNHEKSELWFSSILGFFYQCGIGCYIDKNKALELYLLTVNSKETLNQNLKNLYLLEKENDKFDVLQIMNIIIGKYLLSLYYYKDIILDKINLSKLEYSESARKGNPAAQYNLGYCYQHGKGVAKDYNKAFIWYTKSAKNEYALGQNNLGECYEKGFGTDKNYNKAFELYSKSAENGCAEGQKNLGNCYYYGRGITKDDKKAFELYSESANNGYALGQNNLARCYEMGIGTDIDFNKAFECYFKAANSKCAIAQYNLGVCYENGIGTNKDNNEALKWYFESANEGYNLGQYRLGICYQYGIGTSINIKEAIIWYKKALNNGYNDAINDLDKIKKLVAWI
jgi:TPR repeat protein